MKRYKIKKLRVSGPVFGFLIHTPSGKTLRDLYPQTIVRELNRLNDEIEEKLKDVVWLATEKAKLEDRIKRLEEAGDALEYASVISESGEDPNGFEKLLIAQRKWRKAKEAKP